VEEMEEMEEFSLDNLSQGIKYLKEFNHFLKSDVIDVHRQKNLIDTSKGNNRNDKVKTIMG
jgi:hypothetical protein